MVVYEGLFLMYTMNIVSLLCVSGLGDMRVINIPSFLSYISCFKIVLQDDDNLLQGSRNKIYDGFSNF